MAKVRLYGNDACPFCGAARMLLTKRGVSFDDIPVHTDAEQRAEMIRLSGRTSVPQIFVGDTHVGGFDELCMLEQAGDLDSLLAADERGESS